MRNEQLPIKMNDIEKNKQKKLPKIFVFNKTWFKSSAEYGDATHLKRMSNH